VGALARADVSAELSGVLALAEKTKQETGGYFDISRPSGGIDPSGIVKGWAILNAAKLLTSLGYEHFCIDAGGDIAVAGMNTAGESWSVGIRNPFDYDEIVKVLYPKGKGVATSGSAARGNHIYNPHDPAQPIEDIASITVVGPDILEADRFATAAFAMGKGGIEFIEALPGFEAYLIDANGIATMTSGFSELTHP
jgi:thiamine biosynthesis lipoprotein